MAYSTSHSVLGTNPGHTDNYDGADAPNESTRLLPAADEEAVSPIAPSHSPNASLAQTPLPIAQLGALIAVRIADPIAGQQIFPYINQLLVDLRVAEPARVGFYSGLVESAYSLAQMFSVYQWGRISDIVGRRPVVFTGLIGIAVTTTAFGFSTSFASIVASRFFGGLVAGNAAVIHSIVAEITDDTNQDLAVPIYSLALPVGIIIGPLIGGTFANAATHYPQYFSWQIFMDHPYLPPCLISAACAIIGAVLGYTLIEETLPSKRKDAHSGTHASSAAREHAGTDSDDAEPASMTALLSIPAIRALTVSGFVLSFLSLAFDVVFALFCYTPVDAGGLGLDPSAIGNVLASAGTLAVLIRIFAMPYIFRRFDYAKTYNVCMYIWPVVFGLLPCLNIIARVDSPISSNEVSVSASGSGSALVWTGLLTLRVLSKMGAIPYSLSLLLIKRHTPSLSVLGRSNGLVHFAMCVGHTVAPVVVSSLFTGVNGIEWVRRWGVGWVWAVLMVCAGIGGARVTRGIGSRAGAS